MIHHFQEYLNNRFNQLQFLEVKIMLVGSSGVGALAIMHHGQIMSGARLLKLNQTLDVDIPCLTLVKLFYPKIDQTNFPYILSAYL